MARPLPTTSVVGNVVYVQWSTGQVDHIAITPNADGRTRLAFARPTTDTTPPVITVPGNIVTTATMAQGNVINFAVTGLDSVNGTVPVLCVPPSGSLFPIGTTTVVCTATDSSLNSAQATFTVTVQPGAFTLTAPNLVANPGFQSATLSWNVLPPATSYNLYRSLTSGSGFSLVAGGITSTSYVDTSLSDETTYYYYVSGSNGAGAGPNSSTVGVVPVAVPPPWLDEDIGTVGISGSSGISATGLISMTAAGTNPGGTAIPSILRLSHGKGIARWWLISLDSETRPIGRKPESCFARARRRIRQTHSWAFRITLHSTSFPTGQPPA